MYTERKEIETERTSYYVPDIGLVSTYYADIFQLTRRLKFR
jgi:hypothetical protein